VKQNGNFRSSALFYDYYNIYNTVCDHIYDLQQVIVKLPAGQHF